MTSYNLTQFFDRLPFASAVDKDYSVDDDDVMDVSKVTRKAKRSVVFYGLLLHTMYGFTAANVPQ